MPPTRVALSSSTIGSIAPVGGAIVSNAGDGLYTGSAIALRSAATAGATAGATQWGPALRAGATAGATACGPVVLRLRATGLGPVVLRLRATGLGPVT